MITLNITDNEPDNVVSRVVRGDVVDYYFTGDQYILDIEKSENDIKLITQRTTDKLSRAAYLKQIKVTATNGNVFDGCEDSQNRMMRAILSMNDIETVNWTLSDNTIAAVTKSELQEALNLAYMDQCNNWAI